MKATRAQEDRRGPGGGMKATRAQDYRRTHGPDYHGEPCECNGGPPCACPDCDHVDCSYR